MNITKTSLIGFAIGLLSGLPVMAQQSPMQANPAPGCTATPAELAANKKVALEFFRPGADRLALADPQL